MLEEPELPELPDIDSDDEDRNPIYVPGPCLPNDLKKLMAGSKKPDEFNTRPVGKHNYWTIEKTMQDFKDLREKFKDL